MIHKHISCPPYYVAPRPKIHISHKQSWYASPTNQIPVHLSLLQQSIDLESVFDAASLNDNDTIYTLLDASTNPDIAEMLNVEWFKGILQSVESSPTARQEIKKGARRLTARLRDWQLFEDALANPEGNFADACRFLKEIGTEEKSFGIWLSCMTMHEDLWTSIRDGPLRDDGPFTSLLDPPLTGISHGDFLGFVKAYIGVASVLAVYGWSDSLPNDHCRERTLGVLRLWQDIPGYREVLLSRRLSRCVLTITSDCQSSTLTPPNDLPAGKHDHRQRPTRSIGHSCGKYHIEPRQRASMLSQLGLCQVLAVLAAILLDIYQ